MDETHRMNVLESLSRGPKDVGEHTAGIDVTLLDGPSRPKEWCVRDVMAHLLACGDTWGKTISRLLTEDEPALRYVSPRTLIRKTDYMERSFSDLFERYSAQRHALLDELGPLTFAQWERSGTYTGSGKAGRESVASRVKGLLDHEAIHLQQVAEIADRLR